MGKNRFQWMKRKRSEPEYEYETPVWLGNISNGEFFHFQTERERKMRDEILRRCDDNARKLSDGRSTTAIGIRSAIARQLRQR